ncbi:4Fe-4S binding protein [Candidatus Omnitrophota bacterium]
MDKSFRKYITLPVVEFIFFFTFAFVFWLSGESALFPARIFIYLAFFIPGGMILYALLPEGKKIIGRKTTFLAVCLILFFGLGVLGRINLQLEGLFFAIFTGLSMPVGLHYFVIGHFLVAKILGPIVLNRAWCGWACWTMMVLDYLPYKKSSGRLPSGYGLLRYLHFAISLGMVMLFWKLLGYRIEDRNWPLVGWYWFLIGNAFYFTSSIIMAVIFKDNRAFCKYACPLTVFFRLSGVFALLKIKGDKDTCQDCQECAEACPMDIRIPEYTKAGKRVLSSECTMCLDCIKACPHKALEVSVGFDTGGKDNLNERKPLTKE